MKHTFFIVIILVLSKLSLNCQTGADTLLFFEKLIFESKSQKQRDSLLNQKLNFSIQSKNLKNAYLTYLRLEKTGYRVYNKNYYWNATLLCLDNFNFSSAIMNYKLYKLNFDSSSIQSNLLGYLTYVNFDSLSAKKYYLNLLKLDSSLACMNCFYELLNKKSKKGTGYMIASGIVPGSGLVVVGKPLKGITSMALIGGMAYGVYSLTQANLYVNAINWTLNLGLKFYLGQIKLTKKEFDKKQNKTKSLLNKRCKANYMGVLHEHAITYKVNSFP